MNPRDAEIEAPWGKISLKLWGNEDDPAILTVHGILDNAGSFDGLIPLLPQHYFYICVDLPGHGKSSHFPPHLPIHSVNYIIVYRIVIDYFKREKYIIMGHSYGGQLGHLYAQLFPEKIEKLIMLDTIHMYTISPVHFKTFLADKLEIFFDIEEKMKTRSAPQYTYEEAFDKVMMGRMTPLTAQTAMATAPLTEQAAKALLERGLVSKGNGKYEFSLDQRLKNFINPLHSQEYVIETIKENPVDCPILVVFATDNTSQIRFFKRLINFFKKQKNITIKYVPGHHDVHQAYPERVAPCVVEFLSLRKSKL